MSDSNRTLKRLKAIEDRLAEQEATTDAIIKQLAESMRAHNTVVRQLNEMFQSVAEKAEKKSKIITVN